MCLGIPGKVVETYREHDVLMGKIDFGGVSKRACLEHVPHVKIGDYVVVHVGFALNTIDAEEAQRVFDFLEGMNQLDELKAPGTMKYLDEYRDTEAAHKLTDAIHRAATRPWTIMEMCGGQTHTIVKYGIDKVLPEGIELVHGPGCPVCVTSLEMLDRAHAIAARHEVIFCSFGDMLRVPGSHIDLLQLKSQGSDVRVVYSPLDAVNLAAANPKRKVVFFAIGFETTAPPNAMAVWLAKKRKLTNFSVLVSHVLVPPAITAILESPDNRVQGFLGPGHVCAVMGESEYGPLARRFKVPIVITGFEPLDLLEGILRTVEQLEAGRAEVENQYSRAVRRDGNPESKKLIAEVFEICDRKWRGVGAIPQSGFKLRPEYRDHDAEVLFEVDDLETQESSVCISGQILRGLKKPHQCPAFGKECAPQTPLGATMVSAEGACAAYYAYGRHLESIGLSRMSRNESAEVYAPQTRT